MTVHRLLPAKIVANLGNLFFQTVEPAEIDGDAGSIELAVRALSDRAHPLGGSYRRFVELDGLVEISEVLLHCREDVQPVEVGRAFVQIALKGEGLLVPFLGLVELAPRAMQEPESRPATPSGRS